MISAVAQRLEELLRARRSRACGCAPSRGPARRARPSPRRATIRYLAAKRSASSLNEPIATRGLKTSIASTSSTIVEQVLVVGHRVHAVERVRHVDEPALALDLGDVSSSVIPRGIFSSMNRPMTSPWLGGLDLLGDDHLDAELARPSRRASSAPETSLWSVTAIAPSPCVARGRQQHLDRRRAVVASGRCACAGRRRSAAGRRSRSRRSGRRRGSWRRATSSRVDRLELVGDARPVSRSRSGSPASRSRVAQRARRSTSRCELRGERRRRRRARTAARARPRRAPPRRRAARERQRAPRPRRARAAAAPGAGARAVGGGDDDVGAPRSASAGRRASTKRRARAARARSGVGVDGPRALTTVASSRASGPGAAARAGTAAARRAPRRRRRRSARGRRPRRGARRRRRPGATRS